MKSDQQKGLRVIFRLEDKLFSIHSSFVEAMEVIETSRKIPQSPAILRGIIELRGKVIPLIDLRKVFGLSALKDNNNQILDKLLKFKEIHLKLNESNEENNLEINNSKSCELTEFIKEFQSDNIFFQEAISELRYPHERIHKILSLCLGQKKINNEKFLMFKKQFHEKEFPRFLHKINSTIDVIKNKSNEIFIVLGHDDRLIGITVDSIFAVDYVEDIDRYKAGIYEFISDKSKDFIETVGRNKKADGLVINLSAVQFFNKFKFDSLSE